jgi:hypothetical protein
MTATQYKTLKFRLALDIGLQLDLALAG